MGTQTGRYFFLQKEHKNGQHIHEKVLNVSNHQGNANQRHNEASTHNCYKGYYPTLRRQQVLAKMWRKGNP